MRRNGLAYETGVVTAKLLPDQGGQELRRGSESPLRPGPIKNVDGGAGLTQRFAGKTHLASPSQTSPEQPSEAFTYAKRH